MADGILEEKVYPVLTVPRIKFFLTSLKEGNMKDVKYRKTLISVFVNKIYLYDDKKVASKNPLVNAKKT